MEVNGAVFVYNYYKLLSIEPPTEAYTLLTRINSRVGAELATVKNIPRIAGTVTRPRDELKEIIKNYRLQLTRSASEHDSENVLAFLKSDRVSAKELKNLFKLASRVAKECGMSNKGARDSVMLLNANGSIKDVVGSKPGVVAVGTPGKKVDPKKEAPLSATKEATMEAPKSEKKKKKKATKKKGAATDASDEVMPAALTATKRAAEVAAPNTPSVRAAKRAKIAASPVVGHVNVAAVMAAYGPTLKKEGVNLRELDPDDKNDMQDLYSMLDVKALAEKTQLKTHIRSLRASS
jgi:hypothetical protein